MAKWTKQVSINDGHYWVRGYQVAEAQIVRLGEYGFYHTGWETAITPDEFVRWGAEFWDEVLVPPSS